MNLSYQLLKCVMFLENTLYRETVRDKTKVTLSLHSIASSHSDLSNYITSINGIW